jgi:hypothetical protein
MNATQIQSTVQPEADFRSLCLLAAQRHSATRQSVGLAALVEAFHAQDGVETALADYCIRHEPPFSLSAKARRAYYRLAALHRASVRMPFSVDEHTRAVNGAVVEMLREQIEVLTDWVRL